MSRDFVQIEWDDALEDDCRQLVRLSVREDLGRSFDWTTVALVPHDAHGEALLVARSAGVIAGLQAAEVLLDEMEAGIALERQAGEGAAVEAGTVLARLAGPIRSLLTCERLLLNLVARLSGVATLTRRYVEAVAGTGARIYDTRKTTPGWRRLEKYAVRCGGGYNHRLGLYDAVLIKDNHLAAAAASGGPQCGPAWSVERVREFLHQTLPAAAAEQMVVEIEVDTLEQLEEVLPAMPDIVLLDNMPIEALRAAVGRRSQLAPGVKLEASGGIRLDQVPSVAQTGVDRISVGALTHAAASLDLSLEING